MLLRGWIVPVGGSTPDRLKGRGFNPRPAKATPAEYCPVIPKLERHPLNESFD